MKSSVKVNQYCKLKQNDSAVVDYCKHRCKYGNQYARDEEMAMPICHQGQKWHAPFLITAAIPDNCIGPFLALYIGQKMGNKICENCSEPFS